MTLAVEGTMTETEINLGPLAQIPAGEGREFDVRGERVTVFLARDGAVYATQARCPHREGPLADGIQGGGIIVCPYHAWKFDLRTGQGLPTNPGPGCLTTYPVRVNDNGDLLLTVSRPA